MGIWTSFMGTVQVELSSADTAGALGAITKAGISLENVIQSGDLTLKLTVLRRDYRKLRQLAEKRGETVRLLRKQGVYWSQKELLRRPVLLFGAALLLCISLLLPGRIFFVRVEGNMRVPTRLILAEAERSGISFGASRREVRSEKMKNTLLESIPDLQWAGVNTKGCVATISVREKTKTDQKEQNALVSNLVASRDGIVVSCTVENGNAVCTPGSAVRKGELLISGYTDCGLSIRATRAQGEVYAQTEWNLEAVTPSFRMVRDEKTDSSKKYALLIGKKRINFYKDSGISGTTCDKMVTVKYLTLPGGYELPVAWITERRISYEVREALVEEKNARRMLEIYAGDYLKAQMIAGTILQRETALDGTGEMYCLRGCYACCEMIGREQIVEELESYGKDD